MCPKKVKPTFDVSGYAVEDVSVITVEPPKIDKEATEHYMNDNSLPYWEQLMLDLLDGKRVPENASEKRLVKQMKDILASGRELDLKGDSF